MRILIATPTAEGHVTTRHCESVTRLCVELAKQDIACDYATLTWSDLEMARNVLSSRALARGFTHILFVDSDMGFRPEAVARLMAQQQPIVGAVYAQKNLDLLALINAAASADKNEANWQRRLISRQAVFTGTPFEVDGIAQIELRQGFAKFLAIGMGLALIACEALKTMVERKTAAEQRHKISAHEIDYPVYGFFNRLHDQAGNLMSEDVSFCMRWRQCGGEILAMLDEPIFHVGQHNFIGLFAEKLSAREGQ